MRLQPLRFAAMASACGWVTVARAHGQGGVGAGAGSQNTARRVLIAAQVVALRVRSNLDTGLGVVFNPLAQGRKPGRSCGVMAVT